LSNVWDWGTVMRVLVAAAAVVTALLTGCVGEPNAHQEVCDEVSKALEASDPSKSAAYFITAIQLTPYLDDADPMKDRMYELSQHIQDHSRVSPFAVMVLHDDFC
jgi:hypothetical protein